jgi:hypothetical protein
MGTYRRSGGIVSLILNLVGRWRQVVSFMPYPFFSWGKNFQYPYFRWLCGSQSQSGCFEEGENVLPPPGNEPWIGLLIA